MKLYYTNMNFETTSANDKRKVSGEDEISAALKHLLPDHVTGDSHGDGDAAHKHKTFTAANLLLPTPMNGPHTMSATMAEKSNVWTENKLHRKTTELDKQLYHSMVKMNMDRLEVVNDLAKLKRSSSTGSISSSHNDHVSGKQHHNKQQQSLSSQDISPVTGRKHTRKETISPLAHKSPKSPSDRAPGKPPRTSGIDIRITSYLSSDEEELPDHHYEPSRSVSSSTVRRHCREERAQGEMVENVLRRYAKQIRPKSASSLK